MTISGYISLGVISSCRLFGRRLFVFSRRNNAMRKDEKTPREITKTRNNENVTDNVTC